MLRLLQTSSASDKYRARKKRRAEQQALQEAHALNQVLEKQLHRVCTVFSLKGTAASDWAQCALSRTTVAQTYKGATRGEPMPDSFWSDWIDALPVDLQSATK